jgi:hypothetical protein
LKEVTGGNTEKQTDDEAQERISTVRHGTSCQADRSLWRCSSPSIGSCPQSTRFRGHGCWLERFELLGPFGAFIGRGSVCSAVFGR